ncbi:MAG: cytochrome c nitrite reductase small subunit [Opitutaceae bacterium]|nr:cytochrome c nitrite reductase small subunit [Opitutaceae bacterium]
MKASVISGTLLGGLVGLALGVGAYTFVYAKGYSYLSNNPQACANCHVMQEQYAGWMKSSHHSVATCNDCHTPHDLLGKYTTKADNGFWHSFYFTTGNYPENIQARARSRRITENACRRCHADLAHDIASPHAGGDTLSCIQCHGHVGHMK